MDDTIESGSAGIKERIRQGMDRYRTEVFTRGEPFLSARSSHVLADLASLRSMYDVYNVPLTSHRRIVGPVLVLIKRVLRQLLTPVLERQVAFNGTVLRVLTSFKERLDEQERLRTSGEQTPAVHVMEPEALADGKTIDGFREQVGGADGHALAPVALSHTPPVDASEETPACFHAKATKGWYRPVILGPSSIGRYAASRECLDKVIGVLRRLERDDVMNYLLEYYEAGRSRYGESWYYADITTVLTAVAELMPVRRYLEVGVFHGRSMSMIGAACPKSELYGFDLWIDGYAGFANPGPELVREQLKRVGHEGQVTLISGDSHVTLRKFLAEHPNMSFDVITVDGDHSEEGAGRDLRTVIPHLKVGGFLVFDDISFPGFAFLSKVWSEIVVTDPRFVAWQFTELGNGVAVAVRQY